VAEVALAAAAAEVSAEDLAAEVSLAAVLAEAGNIQLIAIFLKYIKEAVTKRQSLFI
jgi:hypothetical protein